MRSPLGIALAVVAAATVGFLAGQKDDRPALMQIDREFDLATASRGADGWASYFAEEGIMLPAGSDVIRGRAAIRELMAKRLATPGYSLRWEPIGSDVSGDLGYTYGRSKVTRQGKDGQPEISHGKYVTIWKRQRDRSWKIVVDVGNASPPPAP